MQSAIFQIPWRHNVKIFNKVKTIDEAIQLTFDKPFIERDIENKPMGVSEFELTEILPENLKSSLPTIQEIEEELNE